MIGTLILAMAIVLDATGSKTSAAADKNVRSEMLVTTEWLANHLKDPDVVVLCVSGSPGFYSEGHIPGARWINFADIVTKRGDVPNELPSVEQLEKVFRAAGVKDGSRLIIYGDNYNLLAARAYYTLDYLGLTEHAAMLDGGLNKWKNEARPLVTDIPEVTNPSGGVTPHVNKRILVDTAEIKAWTAQPSANRPVLLDARPLDEYTGGRHSAEVHKLGHIPGAKHIYWQELLVSREDPVLLPAAELRKKFEESGAAPGKQVITYCRSGMQSSMDYFVAKYLGYIARMYDASFFEWSAEDLPAETSK